MGPDGTPQFGAAGSPKQDELVDRSAWREMSEGSDGGSSGSGSGSGSGKGVFVLGGCARSLWAAFDN